MNLSESSQPFSMEANTYDNIQHTTVSSTTRSTTQENDVSQGQLLQNLPVQVMEVSSTVKTDAEAIIRSLVAKLIIPPFIFGLDSFVDFDHVCVVVVLFCCFDCLLLFGWGDQSMRKGNKKLEAKATEEEECSSSEDDENAELLTEELEKEFLKLLSRLKKKDSGLYKESVNYFSLEDSKAGATTEKKHTKQPRYQSDYKEWLAGQINRIEDPETKEELEALHDFWTNPDINKNEQFLRDYILNKKFLEHDDSFNLEKELQKLSEEEQEEQEQAIFEEKYNCRFENPDKSFLQKYPQTMKKASGKQRNCDSYTENDESRNKMKTSSSIINELKDHDKSIEKNTTKTEETNVGIKRKHNVTSEITSIKDVSEQKQKKPKKPKHKIGESPEKKQKSKDTTETMNKAIKMEENDTKAVNDSFQHLNKKGSINVKIKNEMKVLENKEEPDENVSLLNKLQEIFRKKGKKMKKERKPKVFILGKDKKERLYKHQNNKQPGIIKKSGKKDRRNKPRHRSLKKYNK